MPNKVKAKRIIAIIGPTASGKSALAIKLARRYKGEVVSADARQVYRGLNLGTGKVTKKEMRGVRHWLLDVATPKQTYSLALYQKAAVKAINNIWQRGRLPILCGGSPFYITALIQGTVLPPVPPNYKLRQKLSKKSAQALFLRLKKLDPARAATIESSNPRRLIRALEIVNALGKVPKLNNQPLMANWLILGLTHTRAKLAQRIRRRLHTRLKHGLLAEVKRLHDNGLSWQRLDALGLEYRFVSRYLRGQLTKQQMITELEKNIMNFAKRQMRWFKKLPNVHWLKQPKQADQLIQAFFK
jgi:tRNA dimethylallyltransferase